MGKRLDLHSEILSLMNNGNVYFQPPPGLIMKYPCCRYKISGVSEKHADNINYSLENRYELIVIDKDPDELRYLDFLKHFKKCRFVNSYASENLNHYVMELYY